MTCQRHRPVSGRAGWLQSPHTECCPKWKGSSSPRCSLCPLATKSTVAWPGQSWAAQTRGCLLRPNGPQPTWFQGLEADAAHMIHRVAMIRWCGARGGAQDQTARTWRAQWPGSHAGSTCTPCTFLANHHLSGSHLPRDKLERPTLVLPKLKRDHLRKPLA